jgi:hypothetical protein
VSQAHLQAMHRRHDGHGKLTSWKAGLKNRP